jgi:hypothetical protein
MKQKNEIIVLIVLVVIAAIVFGWQYWPSGGAKAASTALFVPYKPLNFPNPEIQWPIIDSRRKAEYKATGVNLFSTTVPPSAEEIKKAEELQKENIKRQQETVEKQGPPPVQMPVDMKFFGYGTVPNGTPRRAFLSYQDDVFIVSEGDTIIGRFRILKINNATLEFEELSTGQRGQKILEDQGPTA